MRSEASLESPEIRKRGVMWLGQPLQFDAGKGGVLVLPSFFPGILLENLRKPSFTRGPKRRPHV